MCKTCNKCGVTYDDVDNNFYKRPNNSFHTICKSCKKIYDKSIYDHIKIKRKSWLSNSKEYRKEIRKRASEEAIRYANQRSRQYALDNKEKCYLLKKKWEKNNSDKVKEYDRKVNKKNVELLSDSYIKRLIKISTKSNIIPTQEEITIYREITLLRREKLKFNKFVKQTLNIKK